MLLYGFQDYDVVTGSRLRLIMIWVTVSRQLDVGSLNSLAAIDGATLVHWIASSTTGLRLAGFSRLTDVSFDDFGEGLLTKGCGSQVPLSWITGRPSRTKIQQHQKITVDAWRASLLVANRIAWGVRALSRKELRDSWGRYLR